MFQLVTCRLVSSLTGRGLHVSRAGVAVALPGPGGSGPQELTSAVDAFNKAMSMVILEHIETSNIADIKASLDIICTREPGAAWQIRGYDIYSQATGYAAGKNPDLAYSRTVYEGGDNSLAAKLVTYDHDHQRGLATKRVADDAVSWPIVNHTTKDQDLFNQVKDPLQSLYLLSDTPDSMQGADFTTSHPGLEKLEQERLKSVRGFLNQPTSFEVENDWDRDGKKSSDKIPMVRYLTGNRNYGGTDFRGFSDGGDAFGTMIEDVTRPLDEDQKSLLGDDWKKASNEQARIVGNYTAGYQDGLDHDGAKKGAEDAFGAENSKLRSHTGMILGNWVESFASMDGDNSVGGSSLKASETVGEGPTSPTTGQAQFILSSKLRDAIYDKGGLFTDLCFDNPEHEKDDPGKDTDNPFDDKFVGGRPPALSAVQAGAYAGYKHDLAQAMAGDYHVDTSDTTPGSTWSQNVTDRVDKWGGLFEHLDAATADVNGLNYDRIAERNQLIRQGIDAVSSVVPYDALPGGKIVESLASSAVDGVKNKVLDEFLPTDFKSEKLNDAVNSHYAANAMAAYQEGLDRDNSVWGMGDKFKGEDVFGRNSAHLRSWMGSIISPYVSDLAAAMNNNSESGMSAGTGEGAHGAVNAIFTRDMVERFSGKGSLFEDLAFDQPKVIDEGDPNNPLDDKYESGRIPALKAVQISAFANYMDEVANVLHDSNYDSRSVMVNRVTDKWTELIQETFDADADRDSAVARDLDKTNKDT